MPEPIDFEAEGLLAGLDGDERQSRLALLELLSSEGFALDDLKAAAEEGRLAVLPLERLLAGEPRHAIEEVAERSGVPIEVLERQWRSLGLVVPKRGEKLLGADDLESAHRARALLDSGLEPDSIAELGRTVAVAMSQFAAATRQVMASTFARPGDAEGDVADRIYEQAQTLIPLVGPTLDYAYRVHLREQLRHAAFAADELSSQAGTAAETIAVGFADLVGFTKLGEQVQPEELGRVTGRLEELSREISRGPVRLVKLIGDAAMLASPDTGALLEAMHELLEAMAAEEEGFPLIRAGVTRGAALSRGGDYYGAPVNLASRITDVARPGSVLVSAEVHEDCEGRYRFSRVPRKHLKGIEGTVELFRCRREDPEAGGEDSGTAGEARG